VHLNTSFEAKMRLLPRGDSSRPTFLTSDVFRPLKPSLYERHTREGKLPYGQELPLVERNHFSHKNSRVKNFKNAGYDFGRRGAHRAFQAEPILLKMIFKTGLQNDKQPQSQAIRIKA